MSKILKSFDKSKMIWKNKDSLIYSINEPYNQKIIGKINEF